ncbi:MAG: Gfo/Idh/MocA family protein [Candidatus Xenobia bacterium]
MPTRIRLGVIGAGTMAQNFHLPAFARMPEVELVAICGSNAENRTACARQYGIPEVLSDYRRLLAIGELDAVVIATPNATHAEIAMQALRQGKHVLCERPTGMNAAETEAVEAVWRASGCTFMQALPDRFEPESGLLRDYIRNGHLGQVRYMRAGVVLRSPAPEGWYTNRRVAGGGALMHLGQPLIDLLLWFQGFPEVARLSASTFYQQEHTHHTTPPPPPVPDRSPAPWELLGLRFWGRRSRPLQPEENVYDVEDGGCVMLDLANGVTCSVEAAWSQHCKRDVRWFEVYGTSGGAELWPLRLYRELDGTPVDITPHPEDPGHSPDRVARHFIECLLGRKPVEGDAMQALALQRIMDRVYEAARPLPATRADSR